MEPEHLDSFQTRQNSKNVQNDPVKKHWYLKKFGKVGKPCKKIGKTGKIGKAGKTGKIGKKVR